MIVSAVEDKNPVIFIEHRWCHYINGIVPKGYYKTQINKPKKLVLVKILLLLLTHLR